MTAIDDLMNSVAPAVPNAEGDVPRNHQGSPLIWLPDHSRQAAYNRASSFGKQLEDTYYLDLWQRRQALLGTAANVEIIHSVNAIGPTDDPAINQYEKKRRRDLLNEQVERAHEASGANVKAALGTAIHYGTEVIDAGGDLGQLAPNIRERAEAYWKFCREHGFRMTSIEQFGVEDDNQVAGTWDRVGWAFGKHCVLDVKTSGTMDFAGITFMVQLAEYAHMQWYDPHTGGRTPHDEMDLEVAWIIHVGREPGSPVELYKVDIALGWQFTHLIREIKDARNAGRRGIKEAPLDERSLQIARATSTAELHAIYAEAGAFTSSQASLASDMSAVLRRFGR